VIEFQNVVKRFPDGFAAVKGLDLTVHDGEICVFIGPSGCGKTTSMRMVNRLLSITEGKIMVEGRDNRDFPAEELRRKIGYAIQQIGLFPHFTVLDNIAVVPRMLGWDDTRIRKRVDELLELVGLDPDINRDKYPRQLSGGQQQRVAIARALAMRPEVLLFDEATSALDPELKREVLLVMRALAAEGMTMVVVTHEMGFARNVGRRIVFMDEGEIVEEGDPPAFFDAPRTERAVRFLRKFED